MKGVRDMCSWGLVAFHLCGVVIFLALLSAFELTTFSYTIFSSLTIFIKNNIFNYFLILLI